MSPLRFCLALILWGALAWVPGRGMAGDWKERIRFTSLRLDEGLPVAPVRDIFQDGAGNLWFGTEVGMARYDGNVVHYYPGKSAGEQPEWANNIRCAIEGWDGEIWIGSDGNGLFRLDPRDGSSTAYAEGERFEGGLGHGVVTDLAKDGEGRLWVATLAGVSRGSAGEGGFELEEIVPGEPRAGVGMLAVGDAGEVWAATIEHGIWERGQDGWEALWNPGREVTCLLPGPKGRLVAGTKDGGILVWDGETGRVAERHGAHPGIRGGLAENRVHALMWDSEGSLWARTESRNSRKDADGPGWTNFRHEVEEATSFGSGGGVALFEDQRGVLWSGTAHGEIWWHSLERTWFPHLRRAGGGAGRLSSDIVLGFDEAADGTIWVATQAGLDRFDPQAGRVESFTPFLDGAGPAALNLTCVLSDQEGRIWLGTRESGLVRVDPGKQRVDVFLPDESEPESFPGVTVTALFEDMRGGIWAGVLGKGLVRWAGGSRFECWAEDSEGRELLFVNDIEGGGGPGEIWIASMGGGIWRMGTDGAGELEHYRDLPEIQGDLASGNVTDLCYSRRRDALWIGTVGGGFAWFDLKTKVLRNFTRSNSALPHWSVFAIMEDEAGSVWATLGSGIVRFEPETGTFRRFGEEDGLQGGVFHPKAIFRDRRGWIYAGGAEGFNVIDPEGLPRPLQPPLPVLSGLELYGEPVEPSSEGVLRKPLAQTSVLQLRYDRKLRFGLQFGTVNQADQDQAQFRYRLEGVEESWSTVREEREALYGGLTPGRYRFMVEASRDGLNWGPSQASLRIEIQPPWFQQWWARWLFLVVAVACLVMALILVQRTRMERERANRQQLENERNRAEAALARQLQVSMVLERTSVDFSRSLNGTHVFEASLRRLLEHYEVSRCFLASIAEDEDEERILAQYVREEIEAELDAEEWRRLRERVMMSGHAVVMTPRAEGLGGKEWSTLAIRTAYLDEPNGMLVLQDCGRARVWREEEIKLLESVAGQLGVAVAQFKLSQRERQQRRDLEQARIAADAANQAKSEFLAKMTHELRTPLNAIIGFSEILGMDGSMDEKRREILNIINSSGEHLLGVINDILNVSKIEAGKMELSLERFDLEKLLRSLHGMLSVGAVAKGLRFELVILNQLPRWVECDKGKLRQIIINLVGNSLKFTREGGVALRVAAEPPAGSEAEARGTSFPVKLTLEVFDTGSGIAEADLETLFQKFVQTEAGRISGQGTGLGLSIVRGFSDLMGGKIEVMSRPGFGTMFVVDLPCLAYREEVAPDRTAEAAGERLILGVEPGDRVFKILVAEDQPINRLLLQKLLGRIGFELREAENGEEAVEMWREWKPDLILMDEDMPLMKGTEATQRIMAEAGDEAPVVVSLTAFAMDEHRDRALEAGAVDFLAKPFKREDLLRMIGKYLPVRYRYGGSFNLAA